LMMESVFLSYGRQSLETRYHLVRYGNVVASNGSVIPTWREKYQNGECLPITNKEMTRFWMSPFDAVKVIREGLEVGPNLIYVPKVKACEMSRLAVHLFPNCRFEEVGLRSNEKRHESLVSFDEISTEREDCFLIGIGKMGASLRSSTAELLRMEDFDRMLREAEEVEK